MCEKQQGERRRRGRGAPGAGAAIPLQTMERPQWSRLWPMETTAEHMVFPEGLQPLGRTHAGAGEQCEEEEAGERNCYGLIATPIPHPPVPLSGEEVEESGMKD